jgi:hypothetical protein
VAKDAIKNAKGAKSAKSAKGANPWKLAPLALLGRAGDPIVAEARGYHNRLWQETLVPQSLGAPVVPAPPDRYEKGVRYLFCGRKALQTKGL